MASAQDPCTDRAALEKSIRDQLPKKALADRKAVVAAGKQFLDPKYDNCPDPAGFAEYLKTNIPGMEQTIKKMEDNIDSKNLLARFDEGMKAKNWDEVYAAGKLILDQKPNEYNDVKIVLGSIGLIQTGIDVHATKWNDDTLKYPQEAISDLEADKPFKTYGVRVKDGANFAYGDKQNALGWMNYAMGYIYFYDKNDKKRAVSYLYKASQLTSETQSDPIIYNAFGGYYAEEVKRLGAEVMALNEGRSNKDAPDVGKQKDDALKAKVALLNGTAEAAMDAYARAYALAKEKPAKYPASYADGFYNKIQNLYDIRFGKAEGVEAWMADAKKKALPRPITTGNARDRSRTCHCSQNDARCSTGGSILHASRKTNGQEADTQEKGTLNHPFNYQAGRRPSSGFLFCPIIFRISLNVCESGKT